MYRAVLSLIKSNIFRLINMGAIFWVVILIITLVQQIIINIDTQINNETRSIIWADLIIEQNTKFEESKIKDIKKIISDNGGRMIRTIKFYTTIEWSRESKLVQVKWIEPWYPWYGELVVNNVGGVQKNITTGFVQQWAWIDQQTYNLIDKKDSIVVGKTVLDIQWIITKQNNVWFNFLDEGRTILIPYNIVEKTNLTSFGSRVDYSLEIKTDTNEQAIAIQNIIKKQYGDQYKISLARNRVQQLWNIVEQLNQYTSTILIITLLLSLMVMATATTTMTINITKSLSIMRVIGISRLQTLAMTIILFWSLFVIGSMVGIVGAYMIFEHISFIIPLAKDFVRYPHQLFTIILLSAISFVIACWKSIMHLTMTHPLILLKQESSWPEYSPILSLSVITIWSRIILSLLNNNPLFSIIVIIIVWLLLWGGYFLLMKWFNTIHRWFCRFRTKHFIRFDASRQTILPGNQTWLLVWWLSSALIAFCIIISISLSFIQRLDTSAVDQPNLFVLNVRNEDLSMIKQLDPKAKLYDTILWRISAINNINLNDYLQWQDRWSEEFTREFNITTQLLDNSPIIQWKELGSWGISFDQDFAKRLWVRIGDNIKLFIQWRIFDLTITSLRKSIRTGAEPFFFLQLDDRQFEQAPRSWFWVTRQEKSSLTLFQKQALNRVWPHLSFVDVAAIITLVSDISNKIITIIIACMSIIIVLILLVSIASNEASALISQRTYQLYHIIGMTKWQLLQISRCIWILYASIIVIIIGIVVPLILWYIYSQATILTWSRSNLLPIMIGVVVTTSVMVISYRWFHRLIIKKL